ncbi:hypothetical protein ACFXKG_27475 [Streptomyces sp. NPDC059255]|uniref:hypothetical protein n=1 Tax=Streptomyces sp. NPDC059255 TaxID=3346793 RepID=UPI00367A4B2B
MLALRLGRGTHPVVLFRRLLVVAASAGVGFLLLCTLGWAMGHPAGSPIRLVWCLIPLAAAVQLAVAVARAEPRTRARSGLSAVGLGPARLTVLAATSTAISCTLGSSVALLFFLHLRGDLTGMPFDGEAAELLAAGRPLPLGAVFTLLGATPVVAVVATALALRRRGYVEAKAAGAVRAAPRVRVGASVGVGVGASPVAVSVSDTPDVDGVSAAADGSVAVLTSPSTSTTSPAPAPASTSAPVSVPAPMAVPPLVIAPYPVTAPSGLPWGVALTAVGLAVETYASQAGGGSALPLPGQFDGSPAAVLAGWSLTAVGLALAGPGVMYLCGWLLQAMRPGALRLLAGRTLMAESRSIGRPLGVLCAVLSGTFAAASLYGPADARPFGPLTALGATLVIGCTAATVLIAALEARQARTSVTENLRLVGTPASLLRTAVVVRTAAVVAVFTPLTWAVAALAAIPLSR